MYNGQKRVHGIKLQSVVTPNGLIANLCGPFEGKRHGSGMLHESRLLNELHQVAFHNGQPLFIWRFSISLGVHLQAAYRNINLTPQMTLHNKATSDIQVSIEQLFGNICNYFKFINFKKQMKCCSVETVTDIIWLL